MATSEHESHHSGFLLGLIAGAAITFFLTTKKGRQMLHAVSSESSSLISELEELLKEKVKEELPQVKEAVSDVKDTVK